MLFIVQSPYLFTIGHRGVLSLTRWAGPLRTEFHELRATLEYLSKPIYDFAYGTITLCGVPFQKLPLSFFQLKISTTPNQKPKTRCQRTDIILLSCLWCLVSDSVWAIPISLAATYGIDVSFFSCRYLDVSVPCVRSSLPIHSVVCHLAVGFPHSEILGSTLVCQLPEAYRRLPRLSSPLDAKTSTMHP